MMIRVEGHQQQSDTIEHNTLYFTPTSTNGIFSKRTICAWPNIVQSTRLMDRVWWYTATFLFNVQ